MLKWSRIWLNKLLYTIFSALNFCLIFCQATIFSNSLQNCQDQCLSRNIAIPLPHGHMGWPNVSQTNCDFDCLLDACRLGCQDLDSLSSSCDLRCDSIGAGSGACYQGCRAISDIFLHEVQTLVDLASVEIVSDHTQGIGLNWTFPEGKATALQEISTTNIRWVAQSRATTGGQGWQWTQMEPKAFKENILFSTMLVPPQTSTDIELRLAAIWRDFVVVSRIFSQALLIEQLPSAGQRPPPSEGPYLQLSASSFVVCWNTKDRTVAVHNSPFQFRIRLYSTGPDGSMGELIAMNRTASNCHLFRNITINGTHQEFKLTIEEIEQTEQASELVDMDSDSDGSKTNAELQLNITLAAIHEPEARAPELVFTDGSTLYLMKNLNDYVMLMEPTKIPFALNESQAITALAAPNPSQLLLGLSDGSIFMLDIQEDLLASQGNDTAQGIGRGKRVRASDGMAITQIVVDHLQEYFYAIREKTGILRCQLSSCENNSTTLSLINSPNFVQEMAVDPWNGFIYYTTNAGDIYSTPLFPLDAPQNYSLSITRRIADLPAANTIEIDMREQKLLAITKGGQLMSRDLVDGTIRDERDGWTPNDQYRAVVRTQFHRNRLFWISTSCDDSHPWESCLRSEEFNTEDKSVHLNKYLFSGPIKEFVLLGQYFTPPFMIPPSRVGLILSETEALISWKAPISMPFQASGSAWRTLSYEYILSHASGEKDNSSISTNEPMASIIAQSSIQQSNTIVQLNGDNAAYAFYMAFVKACTGQICSAQIKVTNHPIRLENARKTVSLLIKRPGSIESTVDGSIAPSFGQLTVVDLLGKEIPAEKMFLYPHMPADPSIILAFDNASNVFYISSRKDATVSQRIDTVNIVRFLDSSFIHQMALCQRKAILLVATAYSVVAYRTTSHFDKIIYNCASGSEECGEVLGIATEETNISEDPARIFLLIQLPSGTVQLLSTTDDFDQPFQMITVSKGFPFKLRQMAFADERLLLLTEDGYFGTLDLTLQNLNLNSAIRDVQHLLVANYITQDRHIHFEGPIQFDDKLGQLRWSVTGNAIAAQSLPENEVPLLFKVALFRDGFGNSGSGEKTLIMGQDNFFTLPSRLVQAWQSKQRFDVQLEAISPWTRVWANRTGLNTATKPPSSPENLRIFATQQKTIDGTRAIIDLFWDEPKEWNGDRLGYQLNCTINQGGSEPIQYTNAVLKGSQRSFSFPVRSGRIACLVFAMNDQHLMGPPSTSVEIDGSEFKPLIRLFAIDSMENLVAIQNWTIDAPKNSKARFLAKNRRQIQPPQKQAAHYQTITFVGNEFYAVRKESDMSPNPQLVLVKLDMNQADQVLYKATLVGDFTQIDAMAADWVANRLLLVGNRELLQIQLDQLQQDSATITPKRIIQLSIGSQDAKQLVFDPFNNTAYLLTKNGSLFALDLNKKTETNLELTTGCLRQKTVTSIVGEFIWNRAASPQLYALTWNGLIELKLGADNCPDTNVNWDLLGERGLKAISLFAVADKVFVFATPNELLVYERSSGTISQFSIPSPPLRQLLAASQSAQPFPDRDCFQLPPPNSITFTVRNEGRTGAVVEIAEPKRESLEKPPPIECQNISQPQTEYEVHFRKRGTDKERIHHSYSNKTAIEQGVLDKNTDYEVSVSWLNRYWPSQGQTEPKLLHTGFGFPSAPKDPNALSLSPDTVLLGWSLPDLLNAPAAEIRYRISQQSPALISPVPVAVRPQEGGSGHFSNLLADVVSCEQNPCQAKVPNLRPSTDYYFWVTALHVSRLASTSVDDLEATSIETQAHTREIPGTLRLENVTSTLMNLRWNTLPGAESGFPPIQRIQVSIQYRQSGVDALWTEINNSTFLLETNTSTIQRSLCVDGLRSATMYDYRYSAEYLIVSKDDAQKKELLISEYYFQQAQQARTKAGTPTAPTQVQLINEPMGGWTLKWTAPESDGGEPILNYAVEYRPDSQSEWEIAERGLQADRNTWRVAWAKSHARHGKEPSDAELAQAQFRVRAANGEGFGEFGYTKVPINGENSEQGGTLGIFWYLLLAFLLALCLLCAGAYGTFRWKMAKRRKIRAKLHKPICLQSISQQIQQSHQSQLQFSPEVQNELKILPKIASERVQKTNHLGMGSFGLVCEGFMQLDREVSVRVAIKYLKDNSHENRIKFLKEAILMNNFDHPNIVKLLGVNMDGSEHFLVLELMDGGDLLNFLRDCRPKKGRPSRLNLRDLIAMAVDVGRGCVYLETYKHVHRDIAARNCLISSRTSPQRVTKIADFGLARSLFVDDYYRVHGQDMLPLRWLSPEVITSGLFTSKSDVWAFGVLLWEIITLGEQPYSNRQNPEVLNLISNGICLERPVECPNELYEQMKACWTVDTEKRPRFLDIQPRMESIRGLPHFQSREPFPSGFWNGFDNSQDSSTSTRDSSTTNGGDSSSGFHFEKSENSSTKRHPRLSAKQQRHHSLAGHHSAAFSTATASTALDPSADYELPIRPRVQSLQAHAGLSLPANTIKPLGRRSGPSFQNSAFVGDSSGGSAEEPWGSQSYQQMPSTSNDRNIRQGQHRQESEDSPSAGQKKFGTSSSRVSRV